MNLRPRDRVVLVVVAVLAVLAGFYLVALKPERQKASALQAQITTQQQAIAAARQSYNVGRAAKASLKTDGAEWAALKVAVPEQSDIPALLRTLEKNAKSVHVSMQAITLSGSGTAASSPSAPASAATGTATTATTPQATPVPIQLTFAGGYVALNKLVRKLTGLVGVAGGKVHAAGPLLSINSVALTGTKNLTGQLTATIYQLATSAGAGTGGQG
jgi:type II secretory pathway pseudopilin PulG